MVGACLICDAMQVNGTEDFKPVRGSLTTGSSGISSLCQQKGRIVLPQYGLHNHLCRLDWLPFGITSGDHVHHHHHHRCHHVRRHHRHHRRRRPCEDDLREDELR